MPSLTEKSHILAMWFSENDRGNNWMCTIFKNNKDDTQYKGESRFRYSKGDAIFDSGDEKNWTYFECTENMPDEEIIKVMDGMQRAIAMGYPFMDKLIIDGDIHKFMKLAPTKEWMHIKEQKIND